MRMEENSKRRTRRSTGRKPKTDPAVFRYGIKLTSEENGNFELLFEKSGMKQRARFIKAMIFGREMKVVRIDKAAMDYYIRLTNFYHQFQAIGNNYNQTVKAVKSNFGEKRAFALLRNLEKATIDLVVLSCLPLAAQNRMPFRCNCSMVRKVSCGRAPSGSSSVPSKSLAMNLIMCILKCSCAALTSAAQRCAAASGR